MIDPDDTDLAECVAKALCQHGELLCWETHTSDAARAIAAIEAFGMKIVPKTPTEAMIEAGGSEIIRPSVYMGGTPPGAKRRARDVWAAMLDAAP